MILWQSSGDEKDKLLPGNSSFGFLLFQYCAAICHLTLALKLAHTTLKRTIFAHTTLAHTTPAHITPAHPFACVERLIVSSEYNLLSNHCSISRKHS